MGTNANPAMSVFLQGLSSFWTKFFADKDKLSAVFKATEEQFGQAYIDILESVLGLSLKDCPVFHKENWQLFTVTSNDIVSYADYDLVPIPATLRNVERVQTHILKAAMPVWERNRTFRLTEPDGVPYLQMNVIGRLAEIPSRIVKRPSVKLLDGVDAIAGYDPTNITYQGSTLSYTGVLSMSSIPVNARGFPRQLYHEQIRGARLKATFSSGETRTLQVVASLSMGALNPGLGVNGLTEGELFQVTHWELWSPEYVSEYAFWAPNARVDGRTLSKVYGELIGYEEPSSDQYKSFLLGVYKYYTTGATVFNMEAAMNVASGFPVVIEPTETIKSLPPSGDVVTDKNRYKIDAALRKTSLRVGQQLKAFDALTDALSVRDEISHPQWWQNILIPSSVMPDENPYRRQVTPGLYASQYGYPRAPTGEALFKYGDPGGYYGRGGDYAGPEKMSTRDALDNARVLYRDYVGTRFSRGSTLRYFEPEVGVAPEYDDDVRALENVGITEVEVVGLPPPTVNATTGDPVALRHSFAYEVMDRFLKFQLFGVVPQTDSLPPSFNLARVRDVVSRGKPAYAFMYILPYSSFSDTISIYENVYTNLQKPVEDLLAQRALGMTYGEPNLRYNQRYYFDINTLVVEDGTPRRELFESPVVYGGQSPWNLQQLGDMPVHVNIKRYFMSTAGRVKPTTPGFVLAAARSLPHYARTELSAGRVSTEFNRTALAAAMAILEFGGLDSTAARTTLNLSATGATAGYVSFEADVRIGTAAFALLERGAYMQAAARTNLMAAAIVQAAARVAYLERIVTVRSALRANLEQVVDNTPPPTTPPEPGGGCVDPTTPILIAKGVTKPISEIKVGDTVWSIPEGGGEFGFFKVTTALATTNLRMRVTFTDGRSFICSINHKINVRGIWRRADTLSIGEELQGQPNGWIKSLEYLSEGPVIQLHIPGAMTYFAGDGSWHHNAPTQKV